MKRVQSEFVAKDTTFLYQELQRLKEKLNSGHELHVKWLPDENKNVCGEVRGNTIYIYEVNKDKALSVLRHEFVDYLITSRVIEPLIDLINLMIKIKQSEIYKEKEKIVQLFSNLLV